MSTISNKEKELLKNKDGQILQGFVIKTFCLGKDGVKTVEYLGRDGTWLGEYGFIPYKTQKSAEKAISALKKKFDYWYELDGCKRIGYAVQAIIPSMYKEIKKQNEEELVALGKALNF